MKMIRRHLFSFSLGLCTLIALVLASAQMAQALKTDKNTSAAAALRGVDGADISTFNLGDCLRNTNRHSWPSAYVLICTDLNAASNDPTATPTSVPVVRKKTKPLPKAPQTREQQKLQTSEAGSPLPPLARPVKKPTAALAAPAKKILTLASPSPAPPPPACLIEENGGTTILGARHRRLPPQIVAQRTRSRTAGVALLVPAACNVKSPVKARVLFAGDFKGYRGVVILGLTSKRRLIVAGLDALRVTRGQVIERGAILGETLPMGAPALVTAFNANMTSERSLLFFDMRNSKGAGIGVDWLSDAS